MKFLFVTRQVIFAVTLVGLPSQVDRHSLFVMQQWRDNVGNGGGAWML
jgi:hypothetical protein